MFLSVFTIASIVIEGFTPREIGLPVTSLGVCLRRIGKEGLALELSLPRTIVAFL